MAKNKDGWKDRLVEAYQSLKGRREELVLDMNLGQSQIKTYTDAKLEARIGEIENFLTEFEERMEYDDPLDWIYGLKKKLHNMNHMMKKHVDPYMRSGDRVASAQILSGWAKLYTRALNELSIAEDGYVTKKKEITDEYLETADFDKNGRYEERRKSEQEYLDNYYMNKLDQIERFFNTEVFAYGLLIMSIAFFDQDVTPQYVTVVHSGRMKKEEDFPQIDE